MEYKILEKNGEENKNVDGAAFNNFTAGDRSGIIKGVLNECKIYSSSSNSITVDTGEILIKGFRFKITDSYMYSFYSVPFYPIEHYVILKIELSANGDVNGDITVRTDNTLIQNELFKNGQGTYEVEICRFTYGSQTGSSEITNIKRTLPIIVGGSSGGGSDSDIAQIQAVIAGLQGDIDDHGTRIAALEDGTTVLENRIIALEQGGSSGGGGVSSDIVEKVEKINEALGRVEPSPNDIHFLTLENMQGSISNLDLAIEADGNGGSTRLNRIESDITGLKDKLYNQDSSGKVDYTNPKFERRLKGDTLPEITSPDTNLFGDFFTDNNGKKYILKNIGGTVAWKAVVTEDMLSGSGGSDSNKTAYLHVFEFYNAPETFYIYVVLDTPVLQGKSFFENAYLYGGEIPKYPLWASACMDDINTAFGETATVTLKATSVDNVEYKFAVNDKFIANMTLVSETGEKVV